MGSSDDKSARADLTTVRYCWFFNGDITHQVTNVAEDLQLARREARNTAKVLQILGVAEEYNGVNAALDILRKALDGVGDDSRALRVTTSDDAGVRALVVDALNEGLSRVDSFLVGTVREEIGDQVSRVLNTLHGESVAEAEVKTALEAGAEGSLLIQSQ